MLKKLEKKIRTTSNDNHSLEQLNKGAENCVSILVETGVYSGAKDLNMSLNHSPRDFLPVEESCLEPSIIVPNVLKAVEAIFHCENFV